ncbi:antirestriction protein ArdA [Enterococcus faecalis]|uniref:antirestriction protein ArdA n=1 Tax=Enterococcus faecalis TaxID=1351 RepID=UPI003D136965
MLKQVTEKMMLEANGKEIGVRSEHWIYLTNLKAYNEGYLLGVYLYLPFSEKMLEEAYQAIYVGNEFINEFGESYEEYFITDYDLPFDIGEYDFPQAIAEKYCMISDYLGYPREVIKVITDNLDCDINIMELDHSIRGSEEEKLGYALVDMGYFEIPNNLLNYIDYEVIGKEYLMNVGGEFVESYFVEF